MRLALIGYFDLGRSLSIGDEAFPAGALSSETEIGLVGLNNPFGRGTTLDLRARKPGLLEEWRLAAAAQLQRSETETGWENEPGGPTKEEHDAAVAAEVRSRPIARAELTAFGIGTVLVRFELEGGTPLALVVGVSRCFEFAAYTPKIARALQQAIEEHLNTILGGHSSNLQRLSARPLPVEKTDQTGYSELLLIPSFSKIFIFTDPEDEEGHRQSLARLKITKELSEPGPNGLLTSSGYDAIRFEYHGAMYYSWADVALVPRSWDDPDEPAGAKIARMFEDIRIAHVFHATLEFFERLLANEIGKQLSGFTQGGRYKRSPRELNQLRTLALAVAYTTNFAAVTPTKEDQTYFQKFSNDANINERRDAIIKYCDVLYSIQSEDDKRRQDILSVIVFLLTTLTLISVLADIYEYIDVKNYVEGAHSLISDFFTRSLLLLAVVLSIVLAFATAIFLVRKR